jgi:hypothetical protein
MTPRPCTRPLRAEWRHSHSSRPDAGDAQRPPCACRHAHSQIWRVGPSRRLPVRNWKNAVAISPDDRDGGQLFDLARVKKMGGACPTPLHRVYKRVEARSPVASALRSAHMASPSRSAASDR